MTYAQLSDAKNELQISTSVTTYDTELNDLLTKQDNYINLRLQKYTSLPVQTEIATQLAEIEARWAALRFRMRRATPQEYPQYQTLIQNIEDEFQRFLDNNFRTSFVGVSNMTDRDAPIDYGQFQDYQRPW